MIFDRYRHKTQMPSKEKALPGRSEPMAIKNHHYVLATPLLPPFPADCEIATFGMGCFWGAERVFWLIPGVYSTSVGYSGGYTENPTYEEVCSGMTGHNEVVRVVYHHPQLSFHQLLKVFWESHNPTQGMRQANDIGTQYRSAIYCSTAQQSALAEASLDAYAAELERTHGLPVTTEIQLDPVYYYAEDYHQQYLAKNPGGYCNLQTRAKTGLPEYPPPTAELE